jgi:tellurite resistance protein
MKALQRKKINLLAHIAHIDGKLDIAEQDMLLKLAHEYGITDFDSSSPGKVDLSDFKNSTLRAEILFLALKMANIDGEIHADEIAYCKTLALKLNYSAEVVDHFIQKDLGSISDFKAKISSYALRSI